MPKRNGKEETVLTAEHKTVDRNERHTDPDLHRKEKTRDRKYGRKHYAIH